MEVTAIDNWSAVIARADAEHLPLADKSIDFVFTSPPYMEARTYGIAAGRKIVEWIDWMLRCVREACRVCRGLVLVNCAGSTKDWNYQPGPEGLLYEWHRQGGLSWRPAYWNRVGIPGSGGKQWLRADVEYVLAFVGDRGPIPWANNTANGHAPKWAPGGEMAHRLTDGSRVNKWGGIGSRKGAGARRADGSFKPAGRPSHRRIIPRDGMHGGQENTIYNEPTLSNPGNVVKGKVGGGLMGSKLAHENEAPFPEELASWFIRSHCPPGGIVLDPFGGSGTTMAAAVLAGRRAVSFDIRANQVELQRRRLEETRSRLSQGVLFGTPA